jgi:hypothetical protein
MGIRELILPHDKMFFQLLEQESKNVLSGAQALHDLMSNYDRLEERRGQIANIEHHGDEIVHEIYERLLKSFVTPLDRDEIAKLASLYDDVLDFIDGVVTRLILYEIKTPTDTMRKFTEIVTKAVEEIDFAFAAIREIKVEYIEARCNEVDRLENEADEILHEALAALFRSQDAIMIIKLKEIYELMETITDKCEDVVQEIRSIIIEYS